MNDTLIYIFQFLNNHSFLHANTYLLVFFIFFFNYFLIFFIYLITTKNIHRFFIYFIFTPILIVLKLVFGTTLFVTFNISILDLFCLSLSFLLIFILEIAYLYLAFNNYHDARKEKSIDSNKMLDAYILTTIFFCLNFFSFYPIFS